MLAALLLAVHAPAWVPARWPSSDPASLELLRQTPINCLILDESQWSEAFFAAAKARSIITLSVIHPGPDAKRQVEKAAKLRLTGVLQEDHFPDTTEGLWPGIQTETEGETKAGPTAAAWIDTNSGLIRYLRSITADPVWIAARPLDGAVFPVTRYLQAIGDAGMSGGRWILSPDGELMLRLLSGDTKALQAWKRLGLALRFYEEHAEWRAWQAAGAVGLLEDSYEPGGTADWLASRHVPFRLIPAGKLSMESLAGIRLLLDGSELAPKQRAVLDGFRKRGGAVLTKPQGRQASAASRQLEARFSRENFGVRLFNAPTILSNWIQSPDGKRAVLQLVNYADFPADSVTIHVTGHFTRARLLQPGEDPQDLQPYPIEEGTGVDVERTATIAAVEFQ